MSTLGEVGEREVIRRLATRLRRDDSVMTGIGDDAAVVRWTDGEDLVLTSDAVLEGSHVQPDDDPARVGHKLVGRALSDLASMGARPLWALIDVEAPAAFPMDRLERLYDGVAKCADAFGLAVIGGDLAQGDTLALHIFATGAVPRGGAVLRSSAMCGDAIYVTGQLGGSRTGRHLTFEPRVREGTWLREHGFARAMIDVSDGLATDLRHLVEARAVGAEIWLHALPIAAAAQCSEDDHDPVWHALCDGEDFELLFTVAGDRAAAFEEAWPKAFNVACTRIGTVLEGAGITCLDAEGRRTPLDENGYEHFR